MSEIWTYNISLYSNLLPNYNFYYSLPTNSNIGGVGIYVRHSFSVCERTDIGFDFVGNSQQIESIFLELRSESYRCLIGGVYRHPNNNIINFSGLLEKILGSSPISSSPYDIFLLGDINLDFLSYESNFNIANYIDYVI